MNVADLKNAIKALDPEARVSGLRRAQLVERLASVSKEVRERTAMLERQAREKRRKALIKDHAEGLEGARPQSRHGYDGVSFFGTILQRVGLELTTWGRIIDGVRNLAGQWKLYNYYLEHQGQVLGTTAENEDIIIDAALIENQRQLIGYQIESLMRDLPEFFTQQIDRKLRHRF